MGTIVSLDEFRKNLSDIAGRVMYGNQTVIVQKHNKTSLVVISEKEYESLKDPRKRFSSKEGWDKLFTLTDKIRNRMPPMDQKELEEVIGEEVKAVRAQKKHNLHDK